MGAEKTTLDNYVRTDRSAPKREPMLGQVESGKQDQAKEDAKSKGDMQSEGGSQRPHDSLSKR